MLVASTEGGSGHAANGNDLEWPDLVVWRSPKSPSWRQPQIGALGALISHWSTKRHTPALISLPTGAGKTAVAVAARYLAQAKRTLVIVPTADLRDQLANAFADSADLVRIGALGEAPATKVCRQVGLVGSWTDIERFDVVVGLPNSLSPVHYEESKPRRDQFDLIVIDEAHHSPAPTWAAIIEYFELATILLLTATPRRHDGKALPGDHVFHYPLRRALDEGIFQPVCPKMVGGGGSNTRAQNDLAIVGEVVETLAEPEHSSSTLVVRAGAIERAAELADLYRERGIEVEVLNSKKSTEDKSEIVARLRSGELKGVAVVGMLIEGFDLPSIRVIAYHDKHKSLPITAQMIGRLARVDANYPQASVLVTAKDVDVYPQLKGVVRSLYAEDPDWARILPGIIDDDIESEIADREFATRFTPGDPNISMAALSPLHRIVVNELRWGSPGEAMTELSIPADLEEGKRIRSERILYSGLSEDRRTLLLITESVQRPKWHPAPGLDSVNYGLHLLTLALPARTDLPDLLLLNGDDSAMLRHISAAIFPEGVCVPADVERLQQAFDSVERVSVSSVGMRNSYGGQPGTAAYRMYSGKGVDRGLREIDTAAGAFGHAMVQVADGSSSFTSGLASEKVKYWETRYSPLRGYAAFIESFCSRYWLPSGSVTGQLLPQLTRGKQLRGWPDGTVVAIEMAGELIGQGWQVSSETSVSLLDFESPSAPSDSLSPLPISIIDPVVGGEVVWNGHVDIMGHISSDVSPELEAPAWRGYSAPRPLSELLTEYPPTIFFSNGSTVIGQRVFETVSRLTSMPLVDFLLEPWGSTNIAVETKASAKRKNSGRSIHEHLQEYLVRKAARLRHKWVIHNDGRGEFADYLVIEVGYDEVILELWHAKPSGGSTSSVRVQDLEVVVAQAIKSRRWMTDAGFWEELLLRIDGKAPKATIVSGRPTALRILCGASERKFARNFSRTRPRVRGTIAIAQPGLSRGELEERVVTGELSAVQVRDLLAVFHDTVSNVASTAVWCSP